MRDGQGAGGRARQDIWWTQDRLPGPHSGEGLFSPVPSTQTRAPMAPSSGECPVLLTTQEREGDVSREQTHHRGPQHTHTPTVWAAENWRQSAGASDGHTERQTDRREDSSGKGRQRRPLPAVLRW